MKEYFSHDYGSRRDPKIINLRLKMGYEGVGIYWSLVEYIYEQEGYLMLSQCECIADELHTECEKINSIINDFSLFENDGKKVWSNSVIKRLDFRNDKRLKASKAAKIRWKTASTMRLHSECNASAMQTQCETMQIKGKEIKGKEIKEKEIKEKIYKKEKIEIRRKNFETDVRSYLEKYPELMLKNFYLYWSETDRGNNPKMRFEKQPTWETSKRLATWYRNSQNRNEIQEERLL